MHYLPASSVAS